VVEHERADWVTGIDPVSKPVESSSYQDIPAMVARMSEPLVVMQGVNKHFGDVHVLRDITLTVDRGEVVVLIGPSGSGKSTLCRAINRPETVFATRYISASHSKLQLYPGLRLAHVLAASENPVPSPS
jgi:ABC-type glutathione transport system ATPase component